MEDLRRNPSSPSRSIQKGRSFTSKASQSVSDLRQKMTSLRGKENELQLQQQQQQTPTKHFMSPTLSASSKARKKLSLMDTNQQEDHASVTFSTTSSNFKKNVLIERNEDYTVSIYTSEEQSLASPTHPLSPVTSPTASKPYDPLTNYLTPRPKFLLYKQRDNVGLIDSQDFHEVSSNGCSSSPSSPQHHQSVKEEGFECSDFEDDSDEEKQGILKYKVIKFLFVLAAIVFSTLYISSMNSPKNSNLLSLQGYQMILDRSFQDSANDFALASVFWNQTLGIEPDVREASQNAILDQVHLPDEETSDLSQVFDDSVVEHSDPLDLPDKGETTAATLYVTDIQDLPSSVESTDEKLTAYEGSTGEEEMVSEHQAETAANNFDAIKASNIVGGTDSSGESAKKEAISYKIDEQRIILGDILSTCELVNAARGLSDDQTTRTEEMVTYVVLAMGGIASLVGGIALLAIIRGFVWRLFTKPFERIPSPVVQECVEPALVEDNRDSLLANKDERSEEKEQFAVNRRVIELCHFRAPTIELLGEYVVIPAFTRSSPKKYTCKSSPVEPQQMKQGIFPDRPSISPSCSNTSLDSSRRFSQDKIAGKEEGSTAALRRSNRIRNKTVSSQL